MSPGRFSQTLHTFTYCAHHLLHPPPCTHTAKAKSQATRTPCSAPPSYWTSSDYLLGHNPYHPSYYLTAPNCLFLPAFVKVLEAVDLVIKLNSTGNQITNSNIEKGNHYGIRGWWGFKSCRLDAPYESNKLKPKFILEILQVEENTSKGSDCSLCYQIVINIL